MGFGAGAGPAAACCSRRAGSSSAPPPDLFVAVADEGSQDAALRSWPAELRREGLRVEFDTRGGSLKSQMKRADKTGAPLRAGAGRGGAPERPGPAQAHARGRARPRAAGRSGPDAAQRPWSPPSRENGEPPGNPKGFAQPPVWSVVDVTVEFRSSHATRLDARTSGRGPVLDSHKGRQHVALVAFGGPGVRGAVGGGASSRVRWCSRASRIRWWCTACAAVTAIPACCSETTPGWRIRRCLARGCWDGWDWCAAEARCSRRAGGTGVRCAGAAGARR